MGLLDNPFSLGPAATGESSESLHKADAFCDLALRGSCLVSGVQALANANGLAMLVLILLRI